MAKVGRRAGSGAGNIHLPYDHTMHLEGGKTQCTTLALFFRTALLGSLTPDRMRLDDEVHKTAVYEDGNGGDLRFFLGTPPFEWTNQTYHPSYPPVSSVNWTEEPDLAYHQPMDGEYILITFGNEADAAIRWQQGSIPTQNAAE
ncbi:MAG TPA: hypothetical protein VI997_00990 [Candidatus Thermoplasmatota archaeon]|nr:hypothetical protein [Candidatus Thermoplasmatota archaeon]